MTGEDVGGEQAWAQRPRWARPTVAGELVIATAITLLLLLPLPDPPRRWVVLGLLVALVVLQVAVAGGLVRGGRRVLAPRALRVAHQAGGFWGGFTGLLYVLPFLEQSAVSCAVAGAVTGALFAVYVWFTDPARATREARGR